MCSEGICYLVCPVDCRCGTLVSADSTGSVQFWNGNHGTLLQAHTLHKGDVNKLAATPNQNRVYSAGSDGQVQTIGHAIWFHIFTFVQLLLIAQPCLHSYFLCLYTTQYSYLYIQIFLFYRYPFIVP